MVRRESLDAEKESLTINLTFSKKFTIKILTGPKRSCKKLLKRLDSLRLKSTNGAGIRNEKLMRIFLKMISLRETILQKIFMELNERLNLTLKHND